MDIDAEDRLITRPGRRRWVAIMATAALVPLMLGGCVAELIGPGALVSSPTSAPGSSAGSPSDGDGSDSPSESTSAAPIDEYSRADYAGTITSTLTCPTEEFSSTGASAAITGACETVTVGASASVLILDDVGDLRIEGTGNIVFLRTARSVVISGSTNVVRWEDEPASISDSGVANDTGVGR